MLHMRSSFLFGNKRITPTDNMILRNTNEILKDIKSRNEKYTNEAIKSPLNNRVAFKDCY